MCLKYTVSQKNDTDVAHYNFNAHKPILVIFGRDVVDTVCYQTVISPGSAETLVRRGGIPPLLTNVSALPGET